ncbi:MAG: tripartite tricarboxylate transporter substrate binding protein [Betaproteobacteria bacterium]|nr:tripartite tricarboxylate transporter substrate binding protein [Betaproteobacteria bacterium]
MRQWASACCAILAGLASLAAFAQNYPVRPIRLIVPYPPGGPTDFVGRLVGQKLTEAWGQQVVVENRAGAASAIGTEVAARAAADGYTLLLGTSAGFCINPARGGKLPYDPERDFAPVTLLVINPQILVVHPSLPVRSIKELVALAKRRPAQLNYASVGNASPQHLGMEMLKRMAGIDMVHVPYKGTAPAVTDILAGNVSLMFNSMPSVLPQVHAGKLRGIAVGSAKRSPAAPDIPTVAEAGVPGFEYVTWYGLFAPAGTPRDIVAKLNAQVVKILSQPEMSRRLASQGAEPAANTPEQLARYRRAEFERWRKLIVEMKLQAN